MTVSPKRPKSIKMPGTCFLHTVPGAGHPGTRPAFAPPHQVKAGLPGKTATE